MTATMNIAYGKLRGRWFTQFRIDRLVELAQVISERMGVTDFRIWYDEAEDYHRLRFKAHGKVMDVRHYKVFSVKVDRVEQMATFRHYDFPQFVKFLEKVSKNPRVWGDD